jgi:Pyruvate/2-oxoglutarate dehydrogenase complex, dihydrolipoamide dehydrogenase (E3) component, and related enzymes
LHLESGKVIRGDALLWCNGRSGNTQNLGLDAIGLSPDSRGQIAVNKRYQTSVSNVYAVGDVIGWPSLASAAYDQGRAASAGDEKTTRVSSMMCQLESIPSPKSAPLAKPSASSPTNESPLKWDALFSKIPHVDRSLVKSSAC